MTQVKMKAIDTLHISNVGPDNIEPGASFEISEADAKLLEDRGLAKRVGGAKAESAAPANKAKAGAPENKAISAATISPAADAVKRKGK